MKLNSKIVALVLVTILFGGIGISKALGVWRTESTKIPARYTSGEFAGQYNPEDIRGSFALRDISDSFDIPVDTLAKAFGVERSDPENFQVKELGTLYADLEAKGTPIETASMRHFVALYKGLPYTITEETFFPKSAVDILKEKGNIPVDQMEYLEKHTVDISINSNASAITEGNSESNLAGTSGNTSSNRIESSESEEDRTIKGKTTFKEVLDWGVSKSDVESIIGGKIPSTGLTVRDYCVKQGIEFSSIKSELQLKIDSVN